MILVNIIIAYIDYDIINTENLNRFSSLTTRKVSGLMICLETVKLMEYEIKGIDRELFEIEAEHLKRAD